MKDCIVTFKSRSMKIYRMLMKKYLESDSFGNDVELRYDLMGNHLKVSV